MAKSMYRTLAFLITVLLIGCTNLQYEPELGLVKVEIQKLAPTQSCDGKGIRAYYAKGSNKRHLLNKEIFYVSPGKWEIAYYPTYEVSENYKCEEIERLIIHGEYTISHEFKQGFNYFIYLNKDFEAAIKKVPYNKPFKQDK
jgi:hypothetical protein